MSTPAPAIKDAPAPFSAVGGSDFTHHPSDFILRSCDGFDFHVHKIFLQFASECFDGMLSFPADNSGPENLMRDGKPVLVVPESKLVLYKLLSLAYPSDASCHTVISGSEILNGIVDVHDAARKYQFTAVGKVLPKMLNSSVLAYSHPYRLYAVACLCELPVVARMAAQETLKSQFFAKVSRFDEMRRLTWDDVHTLYEYHTAYREKAQALIKSSLQAPTTTATSTKAILTPPVHCKAATNGSLFVWWKRSGHSNDCVGPDAILGAYESKYSLESGSNVLEIKVHWFKEYIARVANQSFPPSRYTMEPLSASESAMIGACSVCSKDAEEDLRDFWRQLREELEGMSSRLAEEMF